ncbi:uncharacterized protein JCM6883_006127 [Sporobolomyces salmoneus]|uniref:uncharacterized protein n=1 Tax=Sporobolomyces salmoneus TaxID=183962 RepID=UPI00316EC368
MELEDAVNRGGEGAQEPPSQLFQIKLEVGEHRAGPSGGLSRAIVQRHSGKSNDLAKSMVLGSPTLSHLQNSIHTAGATTGGGGGMGTESDGPVMVENHAEPAPFSLPSSHSPFPFPTSISGSANDDLSLSSLHAAPTPPPDFTAAPGPFPARLPSSVPPSSLPSFPSAPGPSNAASSSRNTSTRATPSVPFPSLVLEAGGSSPPQKRPRSSPPPPALESASFPSLHRHASLESSPHLSRSSSVFGDSSSNRNRHQLARSRIEQGTINSIGSGKRGRESYLSRAGSTVRERKGDYGVNGKGKERIRNGIGIENSHPDQDEDEEEDEDEDNIVLATRGKRSSNFSESIQEPINRRQQVSNSNSTSAASTVPHEHSPAFTSTANRTSEADRREEAERIDEDEAERENTRDSKRRKLAIDSQPENLQLNQNLPEILPSTAMQRLDKTRGKKANDCHKLWKILTADSLLAAVRARACRQCRHRKKGFTCTFQNVRAYRKLPNGSFDIRGTYFRSTPDELANFPQDGDFNSPFTRAEAKLLKSIAADKLGPTLEKELEHASQSTCRRVSREVSIINNCDTCLHVMLCGSWICDQCGAEICIDCHSTIKAMEEELRGGGGGGGSLNNLADVSQATKKGLVRCYAKFKHASSDFVPLTRIDADKLEATVEEMKAWSTNHPVEAPKEFPQGWLEQFFQQPNEKEHSHPYLVLPSNLVPPTSADYLDQSPTVSRSSFESNDDPLEGALSLPPPLPTLPEGFSTLDFFRSVWSRGEAMVVEIDLSQVSSVDWSPEFFINNFGSEEVTIGSNLPGVQDHTETVGKFFERFGHTGGFSQSEKIKDWPPSTDFKKVFPRLWQDFNQMLPMGDVTRRDGVLNISTHTPHNANPPDLGPKGYFSEVSDDTPGGQGSTKLHMVRIAQFVISRDAADAVNVLLWSSTGPEQTPGIAVWDLYRAEDADKIREFLYELIAEREYNGNVENARMDQDDPIHTQRFYLDQQLRKELWEKKGVKSWRIHQKPGQVVFVPAGCAHQVCNLSACIKVASDFVSIENVGRCWKVTDEFRQQTKEDKVWKDDILGLKCQLLWAWESAKRLEP